MLKTKKPPYLGGCGGLRLGCVLRSAGHRTRANKPEYDDEAHNSEHDRRAARGSDGVHGGGSGVHRPLKPALHEQTRQVGFCALFWSFFAKRAKSL